MGMSRMVDFKFLKFIEPLPLKLSEFESYSFYGGCGCEPNSIYSVAVFFEETIPSYHVNVSCLYRERMYLEIIVRFCYLFWGLVLQRRARLDMYPNLSLYTDDPNFIVDMNSIRLL